jgi:Ser/Thr protein kinase RdoA (MazF antagonist)
LGLEPLDPGDAVLVDSAGRAAVKSGPVGIVHGDPSPENFLLAGPVVAIIDWATVMQGPARYDLAVLVLGAERAGARPGQITRLVAEYDAAFGEDAATGELARMRALRLAAEIVYFTSRIRNPELAGASEEDDRSGLERARGALRALTEVGLD